MQNTWVVGSTLISSILVPKCWRATLIVYRAERLSGWSDNGLTRNYLRFLLDEIVIDGKELRIFAESDAALQMMASGGGEEPAVNAAGEVRTTVVPWLPSYDSRRTSTALRLKLILAWSFSSLGLERTSKRRLRAQARLDRGYLNPIERGRRYDEIIQRQGASYAEVAKQCGVTREEVCHYVTLLRRLPSEIISAVDAEHDPQRQRACTLQRLLKIARLPGAASQRRAFATIFSPGEPRGRATGS